MAEIQVKGWPTQAAPNQRVTKDSERLDVLAIEATFNGAAAAAPFVPAVQIISDSGDEVGTFPLASPLAAGDSATVTFAPFLGRSSTRPVWARYNGTQNVAPIPVGGQLNYSFVGGTPLLDLTNPLQPLVLASGVYMASMICDTVGITAGAQFEAIIQMQPYACGSAQAVIIVGGLAGVNAVNPTGFMNMDVGAFINNIIHHNQAAAADFHHVTDLVYFA